MADLALDYDTTLQVSGYLSTEAEYISPKLIALKSQIDGLLSQGGGLWMQQTTPALTTAYENFNTAAVGMVTALGSFSTLLGQLVTQISQNDQSIANQINNPPNN
jgi:hypothetical protein